jgi:hypothetical protein
MVCIVLIIYGHYLSMLTMKPLLDYVIKEGSKAGRVRLTLRTADNRLRVYLEGDQAERLALDLLGERFGINQIILDRPKRKRRGLLFP